MLAGAHIGLALAAIGIAALWSWSVAGGIRAWRDGMPGAHIIRA